MQKATPKLLPGKLWSSKLRSHGQAWDTCVIDLAHASVSCPACEKYRPTLPRTANMLNSFATTPRNYAPGRSISLFKILKGKLPGSRIAEFLGFRRSTWPTNCRKWLRIAGNCLRIAIRIAELPSELPGKSATQNAIRSHAQPSITSCLV